MKVLIVDDEPLARRRLGRLIERTTNLEIVGEAHTGQQALTLIEALSPDLLFLDIDMPELDGVALARQLAGAVGIVFTTAHPQHAVEAFAIDAMDYLLKPIEEARLLAAVERVRARQALRHAAHGPATFVVPPPPLPMRLVARANGHVEFLDPARVTRLFASDKYTLCLHSGREYVLDESLSQLEVQLHGLGFLRTHRRELVNLAKARALHTRLAGSTLELEDGQRAQVSRRCLAEVKSRLGVP